MVQINTDLLIARIEASGLKRYELAEKLGMRHTKLSDLVHKRRYPRLNEIQALKLVLNLSSLDVVDIFFRNLSED